MKTVNLINNHHEVDLKKEDHANLSKSPDKEEVPPKSEETDLDS